MRSVKSSASLGSVNSAAGLSRIPDVILPSQFFESVGAKAFSSEQRLMLAILADAINILRRVPSDRIKRDFNEASSWVFAGNIEGPLSFDHVCDAVGLNAESLRRRLSVWIRSEGDNLRRLRFNTMGRRSRPIPNRGPRR
jgi:hypothetical protein